MVPISKLQLDSISFFDVILSCVLVCGFLSTLVNQTNKSILHTYFITSTLHRLTWKELNGYLKKNRNFLLPFNSCHVNGVKWVWSVTLFLLKMLCSFAEHGLKVVAVFRKWNELLPLAWCFWEWILLLYICSWTVVATILFCFFLFLFLSFLVEPLTTCKIASASHQGKKKDNICIMGYKFQISYKANFNLCPNLRNSYAVGKILILSFCFFLSEYPAVQANHSNLIPHT